MTELGSGSGGNTAEMRAMRMRLLLRRLLLQADLLRDPPVGAAQSFLQRMGWLPGELVVNELIVRTPAPYALRAWDVPHLQLLTGDARDERCQAVNAHHLVGADVDGSGPVRAG